LQVIMFRKTGFCGNDYRHSDLFLEFPGEDHPVLAPGSADTHKEMVDLTIR